MKTISKNQKPIDYDVHLKYICKHCGQSHWLSFQEASTKGFKIVCDCGSVFCVKRIESFKVKYAALQRVEKNINIDQKKPTAISQELLNETIATLIPYGFTHNEAKDLIVESYNNNPVNDIVGLVKQVLGSLGSNNNNV